MIPAAERLQRSRPRRWAARPLTGALVALAVALAGGCGKAPSNLAATSDSAAGVPKGDPWKVAAFALKKDTDLATCKSVLGGLRETGTDESKKLPELTDEVLAALKTVVPLSRADEAEIRGGAFSEHDAAYLYDCFYLRDAARALAVTGLPPQRQAELAFEWVCRQVYLHPFLQAAGGGHMATALPPTAVLRRGSGSGLERAYVFLALLQQLQLDACLIGGPDAANQQSRQGPLIKYPTLLIKHPTLPQFPLGVFRGPFWAVGVRIGSDVRLFDPWRGQPFPVTLAQLKAQPDASKAWFEDQANLSGATIEDAKKATVFLAVPVNALSPRMAAFESHLKAELGVKVAFDAPALRNAFPDPKPAFWNPPDDPFAYGRTARSFLPVDQGGADRDKPPGRLYDTYFVDQIPTEAFETPGAAAPSVADRLLRTAAGMLVQSFVEPPNPRELIQRGRFQEAARDVKAKLDIFAGGLDRLRLNKDADQQAKSWLEEANGLYQELGRAESITKDEGAKARANKDIEEHWHDPRVQFLLDRTVSEVGQAEASLLLALCKHEMAERAQVRLERAAPADSALLQPAALEAWQTALTAWKTYLQSAPPPTRFPGRAAHARVLAARAARFAAADANK